MHAPWSSCRWWVVLWSLWVVVAGVSPPAGATGSVVPEIASRKTGMGAVIGRPDDLSAVYHNPAGLTLSPGTNLYIGSGVAILGTRLRPRPWDGSDRYIEAPVDAEGFYPRTKPSSALGVIPILAASTSLLDDRLFAAVSLYIPNAVGAAFPEDSVMRYHLIDSYVVAGNATLTVAWRATDWLSVGGGVSLVYMRLHARRKLFPVVGTTDLSGFLGGDSTLELNGDDVGFGFNLGLLLHPRGAPFTFGLTLISRSDLMLEGDVTLEPGEGALPMLETMRGTQRTNFMTPWIIQGGLNWDLTSWIEIGAEVRYYVYSQLREQRTELEGDLPITELVLPKDYHDTWQASGGVKVTLPPLPDLELMGGVLYSHTPAPDHTVSAEQPSFNRIGPLLGARYRINETFRVALTWTHYIYLERDITTSTTTPPSNFVGGGNNNIVTLVGEIHLGGGLLTSGGGR